MTRKLSKNPAKRGRPLAEEIEEYKEKLLRLQADFENFRKRTQDEKDEIRKTATTESLLKIVPILDNFERSLKHIPKELKDSDWTQGIIYIHKQLQNILAHEGLEKIQSQGAQFDPNLHDAISYEKSKKHKKDEIIEEIESGYKFGDQVLKPAKVRVAK